jgi:hypothetical protein
MRFIVTTHPGIDGVGLALVGHFGGRRFPDDETAAAEARKLAGGAAFTIERERVKPLRAAQ